MAIEENVTNQTTASDNEVTQGISAEEQLRGIRERLGAVQETLRDIDLERDRLMMTTNTATIRPIMDYLRDQENNLQGEEMRLMQQEQALLSQIRQNIQSNVQSVFEPIISARPYHTWTQWRIATLSSHDVAYDLSIGPVRQSAATPPQKPNPALDPKELKKCYENLMVEKVELDSRKRIIVTTKKVSIKKKTWKKERYAGIYQIRINFTARDWNSGIQMLNTTRNDGGKQHPNIDGYICWGTMARDVETDFNDRNLLEVVTDCVDFIQSTNDDKAFDNERWYIFLRQSKLEKKSFLDQEQQVGDVPF